VRSAKWTGKWGLATLRSSSQLALCTWQLRAADDVQPVVSAPVNDHAGGAPVWQAEEAKE